MIATLSDVITGAVTSEAFLAAIKFLHVGAIALWVGGLIGLPWLMAQRDGIRRRGGRNALHRLHATARTLHIGLVSPAAVVAIVSGTALIFLRETYAPWFTAKLGFVVLLGRVTSFARARWSGCSPTTPSRKSRKATSIPAAFCFAPDGLSC